MAQPKTVDFYRCARPVQDRFVAASMGSAPPAPLLFKHASRTRAWRLLGGSALCLVVAGFFLVQGWGDVTSSFALHGRALLAVDVVLFSAAAYCFVHAASVLRALEALPYRAGLYLFPACFIDASGRTLRVVSLAELDAVDPDPAAGLVLRMRDGSRLLAPAERQPDGPRAAAALERLRPELARAIAEENSDMLAELDPLYQTSVSSPISSTQALRPYAPLWMRLDWALALVVGLALGLALGATRNATSDERMYRTVAASRSIPLYEQYLSHGGRHADEVRDVLLPRAELYQAQLDSQTKGDVEILQAFARDHASAKIQPEIEAAIRRGLLIELEKAKAAGTVAALDDFAKKDPGRVVEPELQAARHALYVKAFGAWRARTRVDPTVAAFVERLLGAAEKGGAACDVRFRRRASKSLDDADHRIAKNVNFPGSDAFPSHYLNADLLSPREDRVAQGIAGAFSADFPPDVLALRPAATLEGDAPIPPGTPTFLIDYSPEWSGLDTLSVKPKTIIAGVRIDFDARFLLPEGGAPFTLVFKSIRGPELWKLKSTNVPLADFEEKVYEQIVDHAFDDLQKRLTDAFFHGQSL